MRDVDGVSGVRDVDGVRWSDEMLMELDVGVRWSERCWWSKECEMLMMLMELDGVRDVDGVDGVRWSARCWWSKMECEMLME